MPSPLDILNELESDAPARAPVPADPSRASQFFSSVPLALDLPAPGARPTAPGDIRALFTDLERGQADASAQFFSEAPLDLGPKPAPAAANDDTNVEQLLTDLDLAQAENPALSAQFFGDTPLDLGPKTLPVDESANEAIGAALDDLDIQKDPKKFFSDAPLDLGPVEVVVEDPSAAAGELVEMLGGVVGEVSAANPAFKEYVEARAAKASNHLVQPATVGAKRLRDYMIDFGPMWAPAGEQIILYGTPQCLFKGLKIMATDSATPAGTGTTISLIQVGTLLQRPANTVSLTKFFSESALGNGITFDTTQPTIDIAVTVNFITSCTFFMSVFGVTQMAEPDDAREILT